ncbi:hypothetical protein [Deinococcus humi]|uniref:Polymerase nucleotidyl transferase domain-containing protein n=1 Tax=Deinococcus humi TaxID=662880 RepID=A0A7W8NFG5_9DEIO|nr:hypothetical protein [Deinococcus humi]MBB5365399.1 hypothetical protein [Deinococcus humi]GGO36021.1 hypothetical protein GCM10008949_39380 [Deinococcus humi]
MPAHSRVLDDHAAATLLTRQAALQGEAERVVRELKLPERLGELGTFEQIGSSVSGLMVWPDVDVMVRADHPSAQHIMTAMAPVMATRGIREVLYRDETGERSPSGKPSDERHYFVLRYAAVNGRVWKIDVTVWCSAALRPHRAQAEHLARALSETQRLAVLWIKGEWCERPEYPEEVGGMDVYEAVLHHHVRTPEDFERFLIQRAGGSAHRSCD